MSQKVSFTPALIDRIGPIGRVLEDFLSQQVRAVQAALEGKWRGISHSAAKRVLNEFVSLEGTKKPQSAQEFQALGVNEAQKLFILQQLEKSRILTESDGIYEVAHDTLAKIIAEQRTDDEVALLEAVKLVKDRHQDHQKFGTLLSRNELAFLSRYEARLREYEQLAPEEWAFVRESKRKATRNRWLLIVALAALVAASLGVAYNINQQKNKAQEQKNWAEQQQKIAEKEKANAERQQKIAESERMKADQQKEIADRQRKIAEEKTAEAEAERKIAEEKTKEAQLQKNNAEQQWQRAEEKTKEAQLQKKIAEKAFLQLRQANYFMLSGQSSRVQDDDNTLALQLAYAAYNTALEAEEQGIGSAEERAQAKEEAWNLFMEKAAQQDAPFYQARIDLNNEVSSLNFRNGELIIGGGNGELSIRTTGGQLIEKSADKINIQAPVFSQNGTFATISEDRSEVYYWPQINEKQKLALLDPKESIEINAIALSKDGEFLLANTGDSFIKYEFATKKSEPLTVKGSKAASCIAFLPKDEHFLYAYEDKKNDYRIKIQSLETRKPLFNWSNPPKGHSDRITALSVSPNGKYLVSGSRDKTAILWSIDAEKPSLDNLHTLDGHNHKVNAVAFSPDGRYIATGSDDKTVILWNLNGEMIQTFKGHSQGVTALQWINEHSFASGSLDKTVKIWDITHLYRKMEHQEGSAHYYGDIFQARFNDKNQAITATRSGNIYRWDLSGGQLTTDTLGKMPPGGFNQITDFFLLPGKNQDQYLDQLLYSNKRGYIGLASLQEDSANVKTLKKEEEDKRTYKIKEGDCFTYLPLSPSKKSFLLVGLNEPMVHQYTFQEDSIVKSPVAFGPHPVVDHPAMTAAYFPKSKKVVTADLKGNVYIWSTLDGSPLHKWEAHSPEEKDEGIISVAVSPDESYIATGGRDNKLILWDTTGNPKDTLEHGRPIRSIAFSKNGNLLLTGSIDELARLYRLTDGKWQLRQRFEGHTNTIWSVSFSSNEQQVLTTSLDNSARIWNIIDEKFMNSDRIAPLTASQRRQYGLKD